MCHWQSRLSYYCPCPRPGHLNTQPNSLQVISGTFTLSREAHIDHEYDFQLDNNVRMRSGLAFKCRELEMKKAAPVNDLHHDSVQQAHDNVTESLFKIYLGRVSYRYKLFQSCGRNSSKPDKKNSTNPSASISSCLQKCSATWNRFTIVYHIRFVNSRL